MKKVIENATTVANENKKSVIYTNEKFMKNEIKIGTEVKKVAFVGGNRAINKNNVKRHVESLKKFRRNLVPLLYVDAEELKKYQLYDAGTHSIIEPDDYADYIVVLDGQHRYMAAIQLASSEDANGFSLENLVWQRVELNGDSFTDILTEVNTITTKWSGADFISGCIFQSPANEILQFASELNHIGVSAKTVNKYLFLKEKFSWAKMMKTKDENIRKELFDNANADLQRAKEIWNVVQTFPDNVKTSSVIIDHVLAKGGENYWRTEFEKVKKITDKDKLKELKGKKLIDKFEEMMNAA